MTTPQRMQLSRAGGFRLQATSHKLNGLRCIKVDRSTRWGNPYRVGEMVDRAMVRRWGWKFSRPGFEFVSMSAAIAVRKFAHCLFWDQALHDYVRRELGGRNLACWCAPDQPCHVTPLLWIANSTREEISKLAREIDEDIMTARIFQ